MRFNKITSLVERPNLDQLEFKVPEDLLSLLKSVGVGSFNSEMHLIDPSEYINESYICDAHWSKYYNAKFNGVLIARSGSGVRVIAPQQENSLNLIVQVGADGDITYCDYLFESALNCAFKSLYEANNSELYFSSSRDIIFHVDSEIPEKEVASIFDRLSALVPTKIFNSWSSRCIYFEEKETLVTLSNNECSDRGRFYHFGLICNRSLIDQSDEFWLELNNIYQELKSKKEGTSFAYEDATLE